MGERLRQALDLEHWASFGASFAELVELLGEIVSEDPPPSTVLMLSGDVHCSYVAGAQLCDVGHPDTAIHQLTMSPFRNDIQRSVKGANRLLRHRRPAGAVRRLARWAGVAEPDIAWQLDEGPWFDNGVMSIEFDGPSATLAVDHAHTVDGDRQELDRTHRARADGETLNRAMARRGRRAIMVTMTAFPGHCRPLVAAPSLALDRSHRRHGERMTDPLDALAARLRPAFERVAGRPDVDPVVRPSDRADCQANGALPLAKELGRNPREVAEEVLAAADLVDVATAEIAGPGFINLTFEPGFVGQLVADVAADDTLGIVPAAPTERVILDYSAPNVAKEMHIGHLRTTVIGDALARLFTAVGHDVVRENHIGDWGRPFGMLIEHLVDVGTERADELALGDLDTFYKEATKKFEHDEGFQARARARVVLLQQRDEETIGLWRALVAESADHWNEVYAKLGVLLTDDDLAGESRYEALMPEVLARLDAAGLLEESDGALVVFPPGFTNREGDPLPLIVRSRAGAFTYATSDLACVVDRVERERATWLVYVVGNEQGQHLQMVFAVAAMAGWLVPPARAEHVSLRSRARDGPQAPAQPHR